MFSSSATAARHVHNPYSVPQESARQAVIDKAWQSMQRNGVNAAMVRSLRADLGGDQGAFHDAILTLLDHVRQHPSLRQSLPALIEHARSQPDFDLNERDTEGKTVLDVAVRHDDLELAHYLLSKGANPERTSTVASAGMRMLLTAWRRQNLLYAHFNEGNSQGLSDMDRDLQAGYHNWVRTQLARMCLGMAGGNAQQLWEEMMNIGRHDILRALLITGTPQELRELTRRQSDVGMWLKKLGNKDPGLSAVLKEFPYQSAKRGLLQNFNLQANFTDTEEKIVCRHLVTYQQEEQALDPQHIKFNYDKFRNPTDITNNVKPGIDKILGGLRAQASETHLIDNAKFGQFLAGQFAVMEKENQPTRLMLVESTNHLMNLGLRIKDDEKGKRTYVVKFFDPNITTTGTRSKVGSVQTLEMQTIASYLANEWRLSIYYPEAKGLSMIYVRPEAQASTAISASGYVGRTLTTCIDTKDIDATVIWHLMEKGFAGNLRQLPDHLKTLPEDRRIEIIAGKVANGFSPLYMAMRYAQPELIQAYGDLLKLLPAGKQAELLLAKNSAGPDKGKSGLHVALEMRKFDMVKQLLNMLEGLVPDLSPGQRAWLWQELKGYEASIAQRPFKPNPLSLRQHGEMRSTFSSLMSALADEGASSKGT